MPIGTTNSADKPSLLDIVAEQIQAPGEQTAAEPLTETQPVKRKAGRPAGSKNKKGTKPKQDTQYQIRLPDETVRLLDLAAEKEGTTRSRLIKRLIANYLYLTGYTSKIS